MLLDVNVLVAAHHADHPHHVIAAEWLEHTLLDRDESGQLLRLPMPVISGFLRLVTHPKIFVQPSPTSQAIDFVDWLLENANVELLSNTAEWTRFRKLVLDRPLAGNQIPDAHLAALSLSLGEPFVTFDKDFRKLLPPSLLVLLRAA